MRPTIGNAALAIATATGIRAGRVTHAARQLQAAGVLPTSVGASRRRLRPQQLAALVIGAVLDVPLRCLADATLEVFQLRAGERTFGDALAVALERRHQITALVDLDRSYAILRHADGSEEIFGQLPQATGVHRRCEIPAPVVRELIRRADRHLIPESTINEISRP